MNFITSSSSVVYNLTECNFCVCVCLSPSDCGGSSRIPVCLERCDRLGSAPKTQRARLATWTRRRRNCSSKSHDTHTRTRAHTHIHTYSDTEYHFTHTSAGGEYCCCWRGNFVSPKTQLITTYQSVIS